MHRSVQLNEDNGRAGNIDPCQSNRPGASFVAAANPAAAAHISPLSLAVSDFVPLCIPPCLFYILLLLLSSPSQRVSTRGAGEGVI